MNTLSDLYGTMGAGGITPLGKQWLHFFDHVADTLSTVNSLNEDDVGAVKVTNEQT